MYKFQSIDPKVGQLVDVGACVGKIIQINEYELTVAGIYYDYVQDDVCLEESWDKIYSKEEFDHSVKWLIDDGQPRWDAKHLKHA